MKSTRRTRKGGSAMFAAAPPQEPSMLSRIMRVQEYRNPAAMQQANALMKNPLFNINKIQSTGELPVNKGSSCHNKCKCINYKFRNRGPNSNCGWNRSIFCSIY